MPRPTKVAGRIARAVNSKSESTPSKGDSLRSAVANLLRSRYGTTAVTEEVRIVGGKAADIVFTPTDLPGMRPRIAVECKNWEKPLQAKNIREIRSDYFDAYSKGDIQGLYIISPSDISASVRSTVTSIHWITFVTFGEFQAGIVDFAGYLASLVADFSRDGLSEYYVPSRIVDGSLLHDTAIVPWLADDTRKPLAIVAGYGMGKTTYSRFLAHALANAALKDFRARIPILLPLGAIVQQQSVRSLISYLFADQYRVPGYSYHLFDVLNAAGRFIIIFDAFDEMKHAMSLNDIKHNLEEIKSLTTPRTKAILIGRPDPFLSDDQFMMLRGREKIIGRLAPTARLANFDILSLGYFNDADISHFMTRYMAHVLARSPDNRSSLLKRRLKEFKKAQYYELARRPVQARMIAELLVAPDFKPKQSGIFELYQHFVAYVMRRETEKGARSSVSSEKRVSFLRSVAWWLWTQKGESYFTYPELPAEIVSLVSIPRSVTSEAVVRELLVGSLLDRQALVETKGSEYYYFAHKSYWEFLVCDYLLLGDLTERDIKQITERLTPQIIDFLESVDPTLFTKLYERLSSSQAPLHIKLLEMAARSPSAETPYEYKTHKSTKNQLIMTAIAARDNHNRAEYANWEEYFFEAEDQAPSNFCGLMFGLLYWAATDQESRGRVLAALAALCAIGARKWLDQTRSYSRDDTIDADMDEDEESGVMVFLSSIDTVSEHDLVIDCDKCMSGLLESNLVGVEASLLDLELGSEELDADRLDFLSKYSEGVDFLAALRRGWKRYRQ